ncbi:hypothetical protein C791_0597 [Amycolatopsis azurea DSM 43854]|uniref:Uncharacterized protein n=1 Tax=Amycolatopsis azurea DSM 43854 TaxID=1238180 RepID=M2Q5E8_9PSEU|nr:hypothetical protein C791_0597 [Amycolatopsis azurea DSM 43854]
MAGGGGWVLPSPDEHAATVTASTPDNVIAANRRARDLALT